MIGRLQKEYYSGRRTEAFTGFLSLRNRPDLIERWNGGVTDGESWCCDRQAEAAVS